MTQESVNPAKYGGAAAGQASAYNGRHGTGEADGAGGRGAAAADPRGRDRAAGGGKGPGPAARSSGPASRLLFVLPPRRREDLTAGGL